MLETIPFYDTIRYKIVPPVFLVVFTCLAQVLVVLGNPGARVSWTNLLGSAFAWKLILAFYAYTFLSLKIPSATFMGPPTNTG